MEWVDYRKGNWEINYLVSISPFGHQCFHLVVSYTNCKVNHFICIDSSETYYMIWIQDTYKLSITNGIFIDPNVTGLVCYERYDCLEFINCSSNVPMDSITNSPSIFVTTSISFQFQIIAEICQPVLATQLQTLINLNFISFAIFIYSKS